MMQSIKIRSAELGDLSPLCRLYFDFHEFHAHYLPHRLRSLSQYDDFDAADLQSGILKILQASEATILVAEAADSLLGFAEVYVREDGADNQTVFPRRYALLQSLMVVEPVRGRGVGQQLVTAAQDWAKAQGAQEMQLDIWEFGAGPLPFYERLGYKTLKRTLVHNWEKE